MTTVRERLAAGIEAAITAAARRPAVWGEDDCMMFIAAILGGAGLGDHAGPWRGRYRDEAGARAAMGWRGPAGVMADAARRSGWRRIGPGCAAPGDVGLVSSPAGMAGAIAWRAGWWVQRTAAGIAFHRAGGVRAAWRVV
jgi:hypothetical protein